MAGNFIMNLVLSTSLSQLWSLVNTQQIIVFLPLFRVTLPANAKVFFGFVMQLAAFNLLPTDLIYDNLFSGMQEAETGAINENFEANGFGSHFFLYNMGTLMVVILSMPFLGCVSYMLKIFRSKHKRIETAYVKLSNYLFWSHSITVVFESYSMVCVSAFINSIHVSYPVKLIFLDELWISRRSYQFFFDYSVLYPLYRTTFAICCLYSD